MQLIDYKYWVALTVSQSSLYVRSNVMLLCLALAHNCTPACYPVEVNSLNTCTKHTPWKPLNASTAYVWTIKEPHLPYKTGLDVTQSHPLHKTRFGQYQASSAALGWPGNGDCHIIHRMQSVGWPYSKLGRDSLKAPSLHAAVCYTFQVVTLRKCTCTCTFPLHLLLLC